MNKRKGFTLLEILLSIACLAIISAISIPVYQSFQNKNNLNIASNTVVQSLRRAQVLSQSAESDTTSGVKIQLGSIVVFRGITYAARDITFDEVFDLPTTIVPSGISEIVFTKTFGLPSAIGNIILTFSPSEIKTITINEKGILTY
jgi:prepilin-type N-terminal cleavage/methylation domain-containing protein